MEPRTTSRCLPTSKKTDGPLFRGRYKGILIEGNSYLLQVSRYIHLNPVSAKIVKRPEAYRWSSYRYYIEIEKQPHWLQTEMILSMVGRQNSIEYYQNYVMTGIDIDTNKFYGRKNIAVYFGDTKMKLQRIKNLTAKKIKGSLTDYRQLKPLPTPNVVLESCIKHFKCTKKELSYVRRGHINIKRNLTILACRKWTHATLNEIAKLFGNISINGISNVLNRTKQKFNSDKKLGKIFSDLEEAIGYDLNS